MKLETFKGDVQQIVRFYETCDYIYHPNEKDLIITASENDKIIGVVRLRKEEGIYHLRGMQIGKEFRRKGVGSKMLQKVVEVLGNDTCYLVGYPHLTVFYSQIGFKEIEKEDTPKSVQDRYDNAVKRFPTTKFNIMIRKVG